MELYCLNIYVSITEYRRKINSKKIKFSRKINFGVWMIRDRSPINDGSVKEDVVLDDEELQVHVLCSLQYIFHRSLWSISSVAKLEHY